MKQKSTPRTTTRSYLCQDVDDALAVRGNPASLGSDRARDAIAVGGALPRLQGRVRAASALPVVPDRAARKEDVCALHREPAAQATERKGRIAVLQVVVE